MGDSSTSLFVRWQRIMRMSRTLLLIALAALIGARLTRSGFLWGFGLVFAVIGIMTVIAQQIARRRAR